MQAAACGSCVMSSAGGAHAPMTPIAFIKKWKRASLTERQSAQEHFIDLCSLFGHPTPSEDDPTGERFSYVTGLKKRGQPQFKLSISGGKQGQKHPDATESPLIEQ